MRTEPMKIFLLLCTAFSAAACVSTSLIVAGTPEQKLEILLHQHLFRGGVITRDIRAATGDPDIPVIDHRMWGAISSCSYIYQRGYFKGRVLFCQS